MNHFKVGSERNDAEERTIHWAAIIEQQAASCMSGAAWCRENHTNPTGFYRWRRKLTEHEPHSGFIELRPTWNGDSGAGIRIRLGEKLSIEVARGFDPFTLRSVVETLYNSSPCSV